MIRQKRIERLRLVIILRLFIVTLLLFLADYVFRLQTYIFYYLILIVCALSLFYLIWLIIGRFLKIFLWLQIIIDCILQTTLIHFTGGVDSMFAPIYVVSIISSGILIAPWSSFVIAALSSILFTGIVTMHHFWSFPIFSPTPELDLGAHENLYLFYATYVRITIYFVVAILTNYLTSVILKLEEKVRVQERLAFLGDVTSTIAHEIRNPLAAISNSIEVLMLNLKSTLTDHDKKLMTAVVEEAQRLKRVFQKILDYSKIGQLNIERESVNKVLDHVLLLFENSKDFGRQIKVVKKYSHRNIEASIDSGQMTDVFVNVVQNAYESMAGGGVLTVDALSDDQHVQVTFQDTGVGIGKDMMKNLFLPFKTTKKSGTGLGLAQVHKIVSLHGGSVYIDSNPGGGTIVTIKLKKD